MKKKDTNFLEKKIGYSFSNDGLLEQALTRRSYSNEQGGEDNEVLEFIGDSVIKTIVVKKLMERFSHLEYGENTIFKTVYKEDGFSNITESLTKGEYLVKCTSRLGLNEYLIVGKSDNKENKGNKEDLLESIVGAIAIDSDWNFETLESIVTNLLDLDNYLFEKKFEKDINYISFVKDWAERYQEKAPNYTYEQIGDDFKCLLKIKNIDDIFVGTAKNKKEARCEASKEAYQYLEKRGMFYSLIDEVGSPDIDKAINQLQELYQKGFIDEPQYSFTTKINQYGIIIWHCECYIKDYDKTFKGEATTKIKAKKEAAYFAVDYMVGDCPDIEDVY